jgi:hypothetical protein
MINGIGDDVEFDGFDVSYLPGIKSLKTPPEMIRSVNATSFTGLPTA